MKYYCLELSFDHFLEGDVDWFDQNHSSICEKLNGSYCVRKDSKVADIFSLENDSDLPKGSIFSMVNYGFAGRIAIDIARIEIFNLLPESVLEENFRMGKVIVTGFGELEGWVTYNVKTANFIEGTSLIPKKNRESVVLPKALKGKPFYWSNKYDFILREDLFQFWEKWINKDITIVEYSV